MSINNNNIAIVLLAYADYESLELALACHARIIERGRKYPPLYILQNGRGTYDCERTYRVAKRYAELYPENMFVVDQYVGAPYVSINKLLKSELMNKYDYIIKIDDDVLMITDDWVDNLCLAFNELKERYTDDLAYVTGLVNNNPWGFEKTINLMGLRQKYFDKYARVHFVGLDKNDSLSPWRIAPKDKIFSGGGGTIWRYAYIARWLHENTTLVPEKFIAATRNGKLEEINYLERYSINVLLFEKILWDKIGDGGVDDESMLQKYCIKNKKRIFAATNVPVCHLFFFTQRFENKDLLDKFYDCYKKFNDLPFPISLCRSLERENLERLRFVENKQKYEYSNSIETLKKNDPAILFKAFLKSVFRLLKNKISNR